MGLVLFNSSSSVYFSFIFFFFFLSLFLSSSSPSSTSSTSGLSSSFFFLFLFRLRFLLFLGLVVADFLVAFLFDHQFDRVADELAVLLDDLLDLAFLQIFGLIFLHVQNDLRTAGQFRIVVGAHSERTAGAAFPHVAFVVVVLADDHDPVGDQIGGVETDAELSNHRNIRASLQGFHEGLGARSSDGAEIVDQIGLGHADASVHNGQRMVVLVRRDLDIQFLATVQLGRIRQRFVANFIQSIARIRDQFTQEDFFVGIKRIDDQRHQLGDFGLKGEGFHLGDFFRHLF